MRIFNIFRSLFLCFYFILLLGCVSIKSIKSPYIYPDSVFIEEGVSCLLEDLGQSAKKLKIPDNELEDPFINKRVKYVLFESQATGANISNFIETSFKTNGWVEIRTIYPIEEMNGDWLKVFSKNNKKVLIHVIGPMNQTNYESNDIQVIRTIIYKFIDIEPINLFLQK